MALANQNGGKILVGVNDEGTVKGVRNIQKAKKRIRQHLANTEPRIDAKTEVLDENNVIIVRVPDSEKFHTGNQVPYIREGERSRKMTNSEMQEHAKIRGSSGWDEMLNEKFSYPEDFNQELFNRFKEESDISIDKDEQILLTLGLAEKKENKIIFTNGGILCFANNPQRFFPFAEVIFNVFSSKDRSELEKHQIITGTVIEMVEEAESLIKNELAKTVTFEGWQRQEKLELKPKVPREAIINAIMHRDYYDKSQSTQIDVYPDSIKIKNPGGLPTGMTPDMFGEDSVRRNQVIGRVLHRFGYVERVGSGIQKMKQGMKDRNLPEPEFDWNSHFRVSLSRVEKEMDEMHIEAEDLDIDQKKALKEAIQTGEIDNRRFREINEVQRRTATKKLGEMVEKGYLERVGKTKGTRYLPKGDDGEEKQN